MHISKNVVQFKEQDNFSVGEIIELDGKKYFKMYNYYGRVVLFTKSDLVEISEALSATKHDYKVDGELYMTDNNGNDVLLGTVSNVSISSFI